MGTDFKTASELKALHSWLESETGLTSRYDGLTPVTPADTSQDFYRLQRIVK